MIRLWKLGNSGKNCLPTQKSIDKLYEYLEKEKRGETLDIVWDDMISVTIITDDGEVKNEINVVELDTHEENNE